VAQAGRTKGCLSEFSWAPFRSTKAAIKLHTLLDLRGNIPSFIHITDGKTHEVSFDWLRFAKSRPWPILQGISHMKPWDIKNFLLIIVLFNGFFTF
jgi:hypothetical protein